MVVKTSLHSIDNTVEMLGLSVSSVWEYKLNLGDADAYFHVQHDTLSSSLVGFASLFKPEVLVIARGACRP